MPALHRQLPPTPAGEVAAAVLPLPGAALLSLSHDEALLAASVGHTAHIYSTQQLLAGSAAELAQRQFPADVLRFAWRPGSAAGEFAALLADGSTHLGSLAASGSTPLAAAPGLPAACVAWSPDGAQLALGAGDEVVLYAAEGDSWRQAAALRVLSNEVQDDDQQLQVGAGLLARCCGKAAGLAASRCAATRCRSWLRMCAALTCLVFLPRARWTAWPGWRPLSPCSPASCFTYLPTPNVSCRCCLQVDSLSWVAPSAILLSCKLLVDGAEENYAPLAMLSWQGEAPAAGSVDLTGARGLGVESARWLLFQGGAECRAKLLVLSHDWTGTAPGSAERMQ